MSTTAIPIASLGSVAPSGDVTQIPTDAPRSGEGAFARVLAAAEAAVADAATTTDAEPEIVVPTDVPVDAPVVVAMPPAIEIPNAPPVDVVVVDAPTLELATTIAADPSTTTAADPSTTTAAEHVQPSQIVLAAPVEAPESEAPASTEIDVATAAYAPSAIAMAPSPEATATVVEHVVSAIAMPVATPEPIRELAATCAETDDEPSIAPTSSAEIAAPHVPERGALDRAPASTDAPRDAAVRSEITTTPIARAPSTRPRVPAATTTPEPVANAPTPMPSAALDVAPAAPVAPALDVAAAAIAPAPAIATPVSTAPPRTVAGPSPAAPAPTPTFEAQASTAPTPAAAPTIDAPARADAVEAPPRTAATPATDASIPISIEAPPSDIPRDAPELAAPTSATPAPSHTAHDVTPRSPSDVAPKPPVVLARAEDLTTAIEALKPIPRGGATVEVEAPGLGAIRLHVAVDGDTVKIRIHAGGDAIAWFAREHDGLCSAARQAVPDAQSVDLQLHTGSDSRGNQSQPQARTYASDDTPQRPTRARTPAPRTETTATSSSSRSLVDVLA